MGKIAFEVRTGHIDGDTPVATPGARMSGAQEPAFRLRAATALRFSCLVVLGFLAACANGDRVAPSGAAPAEVAAAAESAPPVSFGRRVGAGLIRGAFDAEAARMLKAMRKHQPAVEVTSVEGLAYREDDPDALLDIHFPASAVAAGERLPVVVWIHGGSYETGAGDEAVYDPWHMVTEHRLVVVNVTYRLGPLGYWGGESRPANLGLLDQLEALRWLHRNIAGFGGDPDNLTLWGQSAGGDAVASLMVAEGARGLFRRIISMSPPLGLMRGYSAHGDRHRFCHR